MAGWGLNPYDIYRDCYETFGYAKLSASAHTISERPELLQEVIMAPRPAHPAVMETLSVPCIDSAAATSWLNLPAVRRALHIANASPRWAICQSIDYTRNMSYLAAPIFDELKHRYKILVYNGDTDSMCNYIANSWAMESCNVQVAEDWAPWWIEDGVGTQVAGFLTRYQVPGPGMSFMTVKGAGHMVPQWKPVPAFNLFKRFVLGADLRTGNTPLEPAAVWRRIII
eukprot:NODE_2373_length_947_cov_444.454036.p1 GENE.NODE_2373_length_947_cov_444.454036~~NODE_2373_length_947_cov_444.454036.p1  ORF type:complete len:243 (+),score=54.04 NODE_2373_length_947_cov_444.454036:50-730(+)